MAEARNEASSGVIQVMALRTLLVAGAILFALTGCGHKDLTAPCERDGGGWFSDCGRLRPVNS